MSIGLIPDYRKFCFWFYYNFDKMFLLVYNTYQSMCCFVDPNNITMTIMGIGSDPYPTKTTSLHGWINLG